jgi:hypothetical protein
MAVPFISIVFGLNPVTLTFDLILAATLYFAALNAVQVGEGGAGGRRARPRLPKLAYQHSRPDTNIACSWQSTFLPHCQVLQEPLTWE